jgi:hypothetical protein
LPGPIWRPTPHQGAAADEVENADFITRGVFKKNVFAAQKLSETLNARVRKFFCPPLEI